MTTPTQLTLRTPGLAARRWVFFGLVSATTLIGTAMMLDIVRAGGLTALEIVILALFAPTFGWISLALWSAVIGFVLVLLRREPVTLERVRTPLGREAPVAARTALVMPAHNEDPARLMAGLHSIVRSLEATGRAGHFDVHLLSDTTDPDIAREEEAAWSALRRRAPRPARLHYRRRVDNVDRKAGNIAEFCATWGSHYDFMVVLDADSIMTGETLVTLVRAMQANPKAGLIQTVPIPALQETPFGRFIQFAGALYSPILATGQAFWQGESANYYGHNAIVRVAPFVEHARLPVLPGRPPLGGRILSHDFVEAALLRRAGWLVYMLPTLGGSYEEVPTNLLDYAKRDRRWAQGSLQHLRLLTEPRLKGLSRAHFTLGAMGYVASVLWLLILLASTAYVLVPALSARPLLAEGAGWLGRWPERGLGSPVPLLALTAMVLFVPKLLGFVLAAVRRRREFGGLLRLAGSVVLETAFSVLIAPLMMIYHSGFVIGILAGRDVAWDVQARAGRDIAWREAAVRTASATTVGASWAALTIIASPMFFVWLSPIFAGLLLAAPVVRWSASLDLGRALRRHGILLVPSETRPPPELHPRVANDASPQRVGDGSTTEETTISTHHAERALFDLRRGRPLCITPTDGSGSEATLCAAVEGLDPASLDGLKKLGSGPLRLIVTPRRAKTMGVTWTVDDPRPLGLSLALDGETSSELFRLSSTVDGIDTARLDARPATPVEFAALALARFGRLLPAVVCVPALPQSVPELLSAIASGAMLQVSASEIGDLAAAAGPDVVVTHVSEARVPLEEAENARFMLFREANGLLEHVAILVGEQANWPDPVPVRLHSACLTGDLFGSLRCDCGEQLRGSLRSFVASGGGVLLYLQQEGRGIGLGNKLRAYALQQDGLDTIDADRVLGFGADERSYGAAVGMLRYLGVNRVKILTNNPQKLRALEEAGIHVVDREPLHGTLNRHNLPYVRAKVQRAGHWLGDMLHEGSKG